MRQLKIPKIWRRALIVVIPKQEKPLGDPKSYRPISLLRAPFKFNMFDLREVKVFSKVFVFEIVRSNSKPSTYWAHLSLNFCLSSKLVLGDSH